MQMRANLCEYFKKYMYTIDRYKYNACFGPRAIVY